jgi:hypothetical protein
MAQIERQTRELKLEYEKYFTGDARRAPLRERAALQSAMEKLVAARVSSTALKFKVQSVSAHFYSLINHWDRIMAQIEAGTYAPDKFKADLRVGRLSDVVEAAQRAAAGEGKPGGETAAPAPEPAPAEKAAAQAAHLHRLYEEFIASRRATGENTNLAYAAFAHSIEKQRPMLEAKFGRDVELKVVVEDGKAKVKGAPKPPSA